MNLTIEEAIQHCLEVAGDLTEQADTADVVQVLDGFDVDGCRQCANDHRQLAEWLMELKDARATLNDCGVEIEMLLNELKEAKRLLKLSLEQTNPKCKYCIHDLEEEQPNYNPCCTGETANCRWIHADEAEKLLGDEI